MKKNGAEIVHLATELVVGAHPIPQKYFTTHQHLHTWESDRWKELIAPTLCEQEMIVQKKKKKVPPAP